MKDKNGNIYEIDMVTLRRTADKAEELYRLIVKDRGLTVWSISVYETENEAVNAMNEMMKG